MNASHWKQLSVQAFVQELQDVLTPAPQRSDVPLLESKLVWQKQTVQDFFATLPWTPLAQSMEQDGLEFSLRLPVVQYFQHFQWNASVDLATSAKIGGSESLEDSPSLEDFSSLF